MVGEYGMIRSRPCEVTGMTLIAALALGRGYEIDAICLAADSRVSAPHPRERYVAHTDTGHKLYHLFPNVFVGFAGDYRHATQAIVDFEKYLHRAQVAKPVSDNRGEIIASIFARRVKERWSNDYSETDFMFGIEDLNVRRRHLYKFGTHDFKVHRLEAGLHVIGPDDSVESEFRKAYVENLAFRKQFGPNE